MLTYNQMYYRKNRESIKENALKRYHRNKVRINKERLEYDKDYKKDRYKNDGEYREKVKERARKYREDNSDKVREYNKSYYQKKKKGC